MVVVSDVGVVVAAEEMLVTVLVRSAAGEVDDEVDGEVVVEVDTMMVKVGTVGRGGR